MQWYYGVNNTQFGPVDESVILKKIRAGEIRPTDRVWRDCMIDWMECSQVAEFAGANAPVRQVEVSDTPAGGVVNSPYAPPQAPAAGYPLAPVPSTSGLAIGAMVMGILGILLCQILAVGGVVCGHMALNEIRSSGGRLGGRGMAIAGLVTGYFGLALFAIAILIFLFGFVSSTTVRI